ncbi:hypothetical protein F5887DRAFT_960370 [Amanita rubescens]|nr:hypothetical protein F5887DRAFT_960370 [Amanita rubescens]
MPWILTQNVLPWHSSILLLFISVARPRVVPHDVFAANGMVPYNPNEPYFHAGLHNPAFNIVPDNHFFMSYLNMSPPPIGGAPWRQRTWLRRRR